MTILTGTSTLGDPPSRIRLVRKHVPSEIDAATTGTTVASICGSVISVPRSYAAPGDNASRPRGSGYGGGRNRLSGRRAFDLRSGIIDRRSRWLLSEKQIAEEHARHKIAEAEIAELQRQEFGHLNQAALRRHERVASLQKEPHGVAEAEWLGWKRRVDLAEKRAGRSDGTYPEIATALEYCGSQLASDVAHEAHRLMLATKKQHSCHFRFGPDWTDIGG